MSEPVAAFRVTLPTGQPLDVQVVVDARTDALVELLAGQDPVELEQAALNRPDYDDDQPAGFTTALLRELTDRAAR